MRSKLYFTSSAVTGEPFYEIRLENEFTEAQLESMEAAVRRRIAGEPLQYILGEWEFLGLPIGVGPGVLIPRPETELLVETGLALPRGVDRPLAADLCAGSGCIGLAAAVNAPQSRVVLADWSEGALRICRQNVRRNNLNARVTCVRADAREPAPSALWDFDVIACNPPYIPSGEIDALDPDVKDYEPRMALDGGPDGLDFYRAVAGGWGAALRLGGSLLFEVGIGQGRDVAVLLEQLADSSLLESDVKVARFLCRRVEREHCVRRGAKVLLDYSQDLISRMLGLSRWTVNQVLSQFKEAGWVDTGYRVIEITDYDALRGFAGMSERRGA